MNENVLVVGCGNSRLSENMFDVGMKNIINIDLSSIVIQQMSSKNKNRKEMQFLKMDMLNMEFEDSKFDAVVDKGTLDALMSDYSEKVLDLGFFENVLFNIKHRLNKMWTKCSMR